MAEWIKIVDVENLDDSKFYFIAQVFTASDGEQGAIRFWSRPKSGKEQWTVKPGIGIHYICDDRLRAMLRKNMDIGNPVIRAIEVPDDYATRWKRRK